MSGIELVTFTCTVCGETKPDSARYPSRSRKGERRCIDCDKKQAKESRRRRREEMGEEAFLRYERSKVRISRTRTGNRRGKLYHRAKYRATRDLIAAHKSQFDRLLAIRLREIEDES